VILGFIRVDLVLVWGLFGLGLGFFKGWFRVVSECIRVYLCIFRVGVRVGLGMV
jgi:hypothetical protein